MYRNDTFEGVIHHLGSDVILQKGAHLEYLAIKLNEFILLGIYISPKFPTAKAIQCVQEITQKMAKSSEKIIIVGDFNIDINSPSGDILKTKMDLVGLKSSIQPNQASSDFNNQIDLVFSSFSIQSAWYHESLISDHKQILFEF